jgi:hypothetical protein
MASVSPPRTPPTPRDEFTETIDAQRGCIRARGCLTRQAADMLAGIVEALHRDVADPAGLDELDVLRNRLRAAGGHLTVLGAPSPAA